jgi:hypothetical protein
MDDFIADKLIEDFLMGEINPEQAWRNLQECKGSITDEKFDDICTLITESLIDSEEIDEDDDVDLESFFNIEEVEQQLKWFDSYYGDREEEDDWTSGNDVY